MKSAKRFDSHQVEFSPQAWLRLGTMSGEAFREIRAILDWLATEDPGVDEAEFSVRLEGWELECAFDPDRSAVLVTEVRPTT